MATYVQKLAEAVRAELAHDPTVKVTSDRQAVYAERGNARTIVRTPLGVDKRRPIDAVDVRQALAMSARHLRRMADSYRPEFAAGARELADTLSPRV